MAFDQFRESEHAVVDASSIMICQVCPHVTRGPVQADAAMIVAATTNAIHARPSPTPAGPSG